MRARVGRAQSKDLVADAGTAMNDAQNRQLFGLLKKNETLKLKGYSLASSRTNGNYVS